MGIDACENEESEVDDPAQAIHISISLTAGADRPRKRLLCLPNETCKYNAGKFKTANLLQNRPKKWSAVFLNVAIPELKQAETCGISDSSHKRSQDEQIDDQGYDWIDRGLALQHQEQHDEAVDEREDELESAISIKFTGPGEFVKWCIPRQLGRRPASPQSMVLLTSRSIHPIWEWQLRRARSRSERRER